MLLIDSRILKCWYSDHGRNKGDPLSDNRLIHIICINFASAIMSKRTVAFIALYDIRSQTIGGHDNGT